MTIVRIFVVYRPFRFFCSIGLFLLLLGTLVGLRFLWFYLTAGGSGHVQSLILASILIGMGFQTLMVAFVADLLSVNRRLAEDSHYRSLKESLGRNGTATAPRRPRSRRQASPRARSPKVN
jgi:hypothetical protein